MALGISCAAPKVRTPEELTQQRTCITQLENGDLIGAETACEICLEYNERSPECLNGLGMIWLSRGNEDKASTYFKRSVREDGNFSQARNNLGVLEFQRGNYDLASYHFESSVEVDPNYLDGRYNLALAYLRTGDKRRAQSYQKEVNEAEKQNMQLDATKFYLNISPSDKKYIERFYQKAEDEYRKIFQLHPEYAPAYRDLGVIMTYRAEMSEQENKRNQRVQEAEVLFNQCLVAQNDEKDCIANLAHLYLANARFEEALFYFSACLTLDPKHPVCREELQLAYQGIKIQSKSLSRYMSRLSKDENDPRGHYGLCVLLFDKNLPQLAQAECRRTLELDPNFCLASFRLAKYYEEISQPDRMEEYCRSFRSCPNNESHARELEECQGWIGTLESPETHTSNTTQNSSPSSLLRSANL